MSVLLLAIPGVAANPPEIQIKLIDGKVCARATIVGQAASIPANVIFDLGLPLPVVLHEKPAALVGLDQRPSVTLKFDGVQFADLPARAAEIRALEALSRDFAADLGEIPAVGIVGLPALADFRPQLDIDAGVLRLLGRDAEETEPTPDAPTSQPLNSTAPAAGSLLPATQVPLEATSTGYYLHGVGPEEFPLRLRFATTQYDTLIDRDTATLLEDDAGRIQNVRVGALDIAQFVALRPEDLSGVASRPQIVLGTGLLKSLRVTIDLRRQQIELRPVRPPHFPEEEQAFFAAREKGNPDELEAWLGANGHSRLAGEAAALLLSRRLERTSTDAAVLERALRLRAETAPAERRASLLVNVADELLAGERADRYALAAATLRVGLEYAKDDLNARAVHDIHARQGLIALRQDEVSAARRLLLSAAFGLPRDPKVNLWLGQAYERMEKPARAWSRYAQALIADAGSAEAQEGLDRLNRDPNFRAGFTMTDAEQLLEGRIVEFHPPDRFRAEDGTTDAPAVNLVELFTCADAVNTEAAELAFAGLQEFFAQTAVVFVQYDYSSPKPDALATDLSPARAAFYEVSEAPVARMNGRRAVTEGGDERAIEKVFGEYKLACDLAPPGEAGWKLAGQVTSAHGELAGQIELTGPAAGKPLRLFAVLCEKVVMLPGANGVILHRQVARAALSGVDGFSVPGAAGRRTFAVHVSRAELAKALDGAVRHTEQQDNVTFHMRPTYVDLDACVVAVFLQDIESKQVLTACALSPTARDEVRR